MTTDRAGVEVPRADRVEGSVDLVVLEGFAPGQHPLEQRAQLGNVPLPAAQFVEKALLRVGRRQAFASLRVLLTPPLLPSRELGPVRPWRTPSQGV